MYVQAFTFSRFSYFFQDRSYMKPNLKSVFTKFLRRKNYEIHKISDEEKSQTILNKWEEVNKRRGKLEIRGWFDN